MFTQAKGFHISIMQSSNAESSLPDCFTNMCSTKKAIICTTDDMIRLNDRAEQSVQEIYIITSTITTDLANFIRKRIGLLYQISEVVALVDGLLSFAEICTIDSYVRPEFTGVIAIKAGRHPIQEKLRPSSYVPNDIFMSDSCKFQIITGPNMSGKSSLLRQMALIQVRIV
eukprot:Sdes_comp17227_c0_seq1m6406